MIEPLYDNEAFFAGYAQLERSRQGLDGAPEWPCLASLLPSLEGATVADLGCGYGWFCREAARRGAAFVLGVDVSEKMLDRARQRTSDPRITYARMDLEHPDLESAAFTLVYSSLTLHYVRELARLAAAVRAALVPGGSLVFSMEHPIYTASREADWRSDAAGRRYWPVAAYQEEGERVRDWIVPGVVKYHRTLGTVCDTFLDAGFSLVRLVEWGPSAEQIAQRPALAEERERPMFLLASFRA